MSSIMARFGRAAGHYGQTAGGAEVPAGIAKGLYDWASDTGRMMTTAPPALPEGAHRNEAGNVVFMKDGKEVPWFDVDPVASRAYGEEMRKRGDLGPATALAVMSGTPFRAAPTGSLGMFAGAAQKSMEPGTAGLLPSVGFIDSIGPKIAAHTPPVDLVSAAKQIEQEGGWLLDRHVPTRNALAGGFDQPAFHGTRDFKGREIIPGTHLYSTPDPELASLYPLSKHAEGRQIMPLLLRTKDYHTYDAKGASWQDVNHHAIVEAMQADKPGVRIHNVIDEPQTGSVSGSVSHLAEPKTVFVTLDPATVRSRFAKFDPNKFHLNDLLASGAAIALPTASVMAGMKQGSRLEPVDHNPFQ